MKRQSLIFAVVFILCFVTGLGLWLKTAPDPRNYPDVEPSITYLDILTNPEFVEILAIAVKNGDQQGVEMLQERALEIGEVAGLPEDQMALIRGQRGLSYLNYRAKRILFNQAFTYRFNNLMDISPLKRQYPEAADLYDKALDTVAKRDALIIDIAKVLAGHEDYRGYLTQAQEEWKKRNAAGQVQRQY